MVHWSELPIKMLLNPEEYGLRVCTQCNGYGSSLKETADVCTVCGGVGLLEKTPDPQEKEDKTN